LEAEFDERTEQDEHDIEERDMTAIRTWRRGRPGWRGWAGSPIEQLCDEELALIVEHHQYWSEPDSRPRRRR
jgi:hypothetical protein